MELKSNKNKYIKHMKSALKLAEKGRGLTNPNPVVGAVIVKDDKVIGRGYHEKYGELHAERNAIKNSRVSLEDSTMYVTLEPCCHTGKTPPCTDAIIESGIKRVVLGANDPNPKVAGKGIKILRQHGIQVDEAIMTKECLDINKVFFHYINTGLPYITMKYAMTMDGKIAASSGNSKWITGEDAREHVHIQRSYNTAIMVGSKTVIADDPLLTSRTDKGAKRDPVRIICDTNLSIPVESKVVETASSVRTIIATSKDKQAAKPYTDAGCEILTVNTKDGKIDLHQLMELLGADKIDSILLEGGSTLNWGMLESGLVNKIQAYIAPKIFGGDKSKTPVGGVGAVKPDDGLITSPTEITRLGNDILLESEVIECSRE